MKKLWHAGAGNCRGLTLLETLIAAFILLLVLLSMISAYALGRINVDREEVKRKASAIAQDRLDQVRARYAATAPFGWELIDSTAIDTNYNVDGKTFQLKSSVADSGGPKGARKIVSVNVKWTAKRNNNTSVQRQIRTQTVINRIFNF